MPAGRKKTITAPRVNVSVLLETDLHRDLKEMAKEESRSLIGEITFALKFYRDQYRAKKAKA